VNRELLKELIKHKEEEAAALVEERQIFQREQQEWRLQKSQELVNGAERKLMAEVWLNRAIQVIKPHMMPEARRRNWVFQQQKWDAHKAIAIGFAREEGKLEGHRKGLKEAYDRGRDEDIDKAYQEAYDDGHRDARLETEVRLLEATEEAYRNGFDERLNHYDTNRQEAGWARGFQQGKDAGQTFQQQEFGKAEYARGREEGLAQGRIQGKIEGERQANQEAEKRRELTQIEDQHTGFHKAMLMCYTVGKKPDLPESEGYEADPYLWCRALAALIKKFQS
jgi:hypothetical protein